MAHQSFWGQFRASFSKNRLLKKRQRKETMIEIGYPIYFSVILLLITGPMKSSINLGAERTPPLHEPRLPYKCGSDPFNASLEAFCLILYTPNSSAVRGAVSDAVEMLGFSNYSAVPFADMETLKAAYTAAPALQVRTLAAIDLHLPEGQPEQWTYELFFPQVGASDHPGIFSAEDLDPTHRKFDLSRNSSSEISLMGSKWLSSGALSLQWALDRSIASQATGGASTPLMAALGGDSLRVGKMPLPAYEAAFLPETVTVVSYIVPLYLALGLAVPLQFAAINVAQEKEKGLLEELRVMGLRELPATLSWWALYLLVHTISATVMTMGVVLAGILPHSSPILLWLLMWLFVAAGLAVCFVITAITPNAKAASALYTLNYMAGLGLYAAYNAAGTPVPLGVLISLLSPYAALCVGLRTFVGQELTGVGLTVATMGSTPLPLAVSFLLIVVVIAWGILLSAYISLVSTHGVPWYGPCLRLLPCLSSRSSAASTLRHSGRLLAELRQSGDPGGVTEVGVAEEGGRAQAAVSTSRLQKIFPATGGPVHALRGVTVDMPSGAVTALLGQNGAGKSTLIGVLTGTIKPTRGDARVLGHDVKTQMDQIRAQTGCCAQSDKLYNTLTVSEHIELFGGVKGVPQDALRNEAARLLKEVGLTREDGEKPAASLSGGQKRRLSVAKALIGAPPFVILDEPTAGLDPQSRRKIWALVLAERAARTFLLTTHFMDEVDALSDKVAVIANGKLCCPISTALALKTDYGSGFHLRFALDQDATAASSTRLLKFVGESVAGSHIEEVQHRDVCIGLPTTEQATFSALFRRLNEQALGDLGATSFGVTMPTLQEVFLRIIDDAEKADAQSEAPNADADSPPGDSRELLTGGGPSSDAPPVASMDIRGGAPTFSQQLSAMLRKHAWSARQAPNVASIVFPLLFLFLSFVLPAVIKPGDAPRLSLDASSFALAHRGAPLPFSPADGSLQTLVAAAASGYGLVPVPLATSIPPGSSEDAALEATVATLDEHLWNDGAFSAQSPFGAFAVPPNASGILYNSSFPNTLPGQLAMLDDALTRLAAPNLKLKASASLLPLPNKDLATSTATALRQVLPPLLLQIALIVLLLPLVVAVVKDRADKCFHLLLLTGLDLKVYWLSSLLFDTGFVYLGFSVLAAILGGASGGLSGSSVAILLILTAVALPAFLLFSYVLSLRFSKPEDATKFFTVLLILVTLVPNAIVGIISSASAKQTLSITTMIIPLNQIIQGTRACLQLDAQARFAAAIGQPTPSFGDYFALQVPPTYGSPPGTPGQPGPLMCLLFALGSLVLWGGRLYHRSIRRYLHGRAPTGERYQAQSPTLAEDDDVRAEEARIEGQSAADALAVRALHVSKVFRSRRGSTVAVKSLTLGIEHKTCFALLGPNGAGKTTTFSMLTGDVPPSGGEAWICGLSTATEILRIFRLTGFCPQFNGLWQQLTLRQHLVLYARLRGLEGSELEACVASIIEEFGLSAHAHKFVKALSGGTRRKLSAAIAMAAPGSKVSFLDEPTTGVDVGTRRFIWDRIKAASAHRTVVLTTHYMEEAETLAHRIGILVAGRLHSLGSLQHLKAKFAAGYVIEVQSKSATGAAEEEEDRAADRQMTTFIQSIFTDAALVEVHGSMRRYEVRAAFSMAAAFEQLEKAKGGLLPASLQLGVESYAVSQMSLEHVFLSIVAAQTAEAGDSVREGALAATA